MNTYTTMHRRRSTARRATALRLRVAAAASAAFASLSSMAFLLVVLMPALEFGATASPV